MALLIGGAECLNGAETWLNMGCEMGLLDCGMALLNGGAAWLNRDEAWLQYSKWECMACLIGKRHGKILVHATLINRGCGIAKWDISPCGMKNDLCMQHGLMEDAA